MSSFSITRKKTPFQKHREEEEAKKKREEDETARLYEQFVASFQGDNAPGSKAFVRGGTINPNEKFKPDSEGEKAKDGVSVPKKGSRYVPSFIPPPLSAKGKESEKKKEEERPKEKEKGKSRNIDHFMEELKHEQEMRERRNQDREHWRDGRHSDNSAPSSRFDELPDDFDPSGKLPGSFDDGDPQTTNLYVGNLSPKVDENFLLRTFGRFGPIASVKIMWPRTEEERRRQRNCGFVAFMNRADGQAAKDEMQGVVVYEYELKIGWGKSVALPSQALPAPPPGHMAIRSKEGSSIILSGPSGPPVTSVPNQNSELVLTPNVPDIMVPPPDDDHLRHVIDTMALYVLDGGCAFEQAIMERGRGNPLFSFLFELGSKEHTYYVWRLYSFAQGDTLQRWRTEPFIMITGSGRWVPPPLPTTRSPEHEKDYTATYAAGRSRWLEPERTLNDPQRDEFEDMLRALTLERSQIKEAMGFALDNADAAGEIVEVLTESLTLKETPIPTKVARLMLVSDILHNSSAPVKNASAYRTKFEATLPDIMESFNDLYRSVTGRITAEALKERVLKVLQVWSDWFLFSDAYVNGLRATFLRSGNSGVAHFHSICGNAPAIKNKISSEDAVNGIKANQDAALAMGKGALQVMDRRWPWKKKSSDKADKDAAAAAAEADAAAAALASAASQNDQNTYKKPKYVQISMESYSHLTGLENQVKIYEEQVQTLENEIKHLNEKLSAANSEISGKEDLVKQHTKVAEEAVSGWEKAEAEALALKNHLESVTLLKLTAEDRASHLDGALKECMRQIRNLKEEHEQKLQDLAVSKNKQCEKIKLELEAKIAYLDQELCKSAAENDAISRSLQERSNMLVKITEEKSQAETQIECLKGNIESCEREINSLKYEIHVVSKELEIRNEERNMSMRTAEAANKQHMEGVKKIAKLEAECQRLRGLVRKKLPGPAALAQMKLEVESLGRDYGDTRLKRSPVRPSTPHTPAVTDFSLDNAQKFHKENEFLTERLLAMEEETKMLKEALAKRNSELLASRNLCAKTSTKLQTLEAQLAISNQQRSPSKVSNSPSVTSVSEDGIDDEKSCADSWATSMISELSQFKKEKSIEKLNKTENVKHLDLMDDFLEMEKLACSSNDSTANGAITNAGSTNNKSPEAVNADASGETSCKELQSGKQHDLSPPANHGPIVHPESDADKLLVMKLHSKLSMVLESMSKDADAHKILDDIKCAIQDAQDTLSDHSVNGVSEEVDGSEGKCNRQGHPENGSLTEGKDIAVPPGDKVTTETLQTISQELAVAISQIHDFVISLGKEASAVDNISSDAYGLSHKIDDFSVTYNKVLCSNVNLDDFIFGLSTVLAKASELRFNVLGFKSNEAEMNGPDCIDKVALPENKVNQNDSSGGRYQNGCAHISNPTSNPEDPDDGNLVSEYESKQASNISSEEFEELKLEKENMAMDLSRCTENLEMTKSQLHETEQLLAEAKSQLAAAQKSNSLAETQLKCMVESYRSLERRAGELETDVNLLSTKINTLENELQDEKRSHHDAFSRCKELEEQLQRNEKCFVCSAADNDLKNNQERELAAAAEKLAECQETIFLLGKKLKALHPQTDKIGSPYNERSQKGEGFREDEPTTSGMNLQDLDQADIDTAASGNGSQTGAESPMESFNTPCSPPNTEGNVLRSPVSSKHRSTMSSSLSTTPATTPEKHSRGFSRFFSSKGKNGV